MCPRTGEGAKGDIETPNPVPVLELDGQLLEGEETIHLTQGGQPDTGLFDKKESWAKKKG